MHPNDPLRLGWMLNVIIKQKKNKRVKHVCSLKTAVLVARWIMHVYKNTHADLKFGLIYYTTGIV